MRFPFVSRWLDEKREQRRLDREWYAAYLRKQDAAIDAEIVDYEHEQMNQDIGFGDEPG